MKVRVQAPIVHLCPFKDEMDVGTVEFEWDDVAEAPELHRVRALIDGFHGERISHEALTEALALAYPGASVTTRWTTAGMEVTCST